MTKACRELVRAIGKNDHMAEGLIGYALMFDELNRCC